MSGFWIYRVWVGFIAFFPMFLHSMQDHWCLLISRSHIRLPWVQDHASPRMIGTVFLAHFSHYHSKVLALINREIIFNPRPAKGGGGGCT